MLRVEIWQWNYFNRNLQNFGQETFNGRKDLEALAQVFDNITMRPKEFVGRILAYFAGDRLQFVVNTAINRLIPWKVENVLTSWTSDGFWRILLHDVRSHEQIKAEEGCWTSGMEELLLK